LGVISRITPPYFCAASETARDVSGWYAEMPLGSLPDHKFAHHAMQNEEVKKLPKTSDNAGFHYIIEVYVDDFISLAAASAQDQLEHVAKAVMHGVHDVFPADEIDDNDPLSLKKLLKLEGEWALLKEVLGFEFDGVAKTMQLEPKKRDALLDVLSKWLRAAKKRMKSIQFKDFESVVSKIRHAFTAIPAGNVLQKRPEWVYLHSNKKLQTALSDMRTLLREASKEPTKCSELVMQHPHFIGVKDASVHGVGGVIFGEGKARKPTVFRFEWPEWIRGEVRKTNSGRGGTLTAMAHNGRRL
jgi:hypothetical protein